MILGWTFKQWAHAKQRYGQDIPPTFEGMTELKRWWMLHQNVEPLSVKLYGVEPGLDYNWAATAFKNACITYNSLMEEMKTA